MNSRPLTDNFTPGARIFYLICGNPSKLIGRGVANTVTASLNSVHLHAGELSQNIRNFFQSRPVELNILPGRKVHVTLIKFARDFSHFAYLGARHKAVGHSDPQHRRKALNIEPILQAQR